MISIMALVLGISVQCAHQGAIGSCSGWIVGKLNLSGFRCGFRTAARLVGRDLRSCHSETDLLLTGHQPVAAQPFHKRTLVSEAFMIDKKAIAADERLRQEFNQWAEQGRGEEMENHHSASPSKRWRGWS